MPGLLLSLALLAPPSITIYNAPTTTLAVPVETPSVSIKDIATRDADRYHISFDRYWHTISCEDHALDPKMQSLVPDPSGPNGRENSWGLAMIDLDFHPDITRREAQDPVFALNYMARAFAELPPRALGDLFHCYRTLYETP